MYVNNICFYFKIIFYYYLFLANCMSWPLFASLAALASLAMACNFCLLCQRYGYIATTNKTSQQSLLFLFVEPIVIDSVITYTIVIQQKALHL
jgi:hypothetical protein